MNDHERRARPCEISAVPRRFDQVAPVSRFAVSAVSDQRRRSLAQDSCNLGCLTWLRIGYGDTACPSPPPTSRTSRTRAIYFAEWDAGVSDPSRYYRGSTRAIDRVEDPHGDDIRVEIYSSQSVAGDVTRLIAFDEGNYERTHLTIAAHAREFGQALIAAADRSTRLPATIRRWTDDDRD